MPSPLVVVDRAAATPAHEQIAGWIRAAVESGALSPGDRLPGERALADSLDVSRMTLRQALSVLAAEGVLVRVAGRGGGAYVQAPQVPVDLTELTGLTDQLARHHRRPGARVLRAARTTAGAAGCADGLQLPPRAHVIVVERLRLTGGLPLGVEQSAFPARLVPGLLDRRLTGSLYSLLDKRYGLLPHEAVEWLEPVSADAALASLLAVLPGAPLMRVVRTARTAAGVPVEHATDIFRPDRVRFVVRRGPTGSRPGAELA